MNVRLTAIPVTLIALLAYGEAQAQVEYSFEATDDYLAPAAAWPAWQQVLIQHELEREALQRCVDSKDECSRRMRGLHHLLIKGKDLTLEQQVRLVNRYINKKRYVDDRIAFRSEVGNKWETLTEFLNTGGDCEDFAVAKYFVLREFGVPAEDMRVVVGKEYRRSDHHAMLAVNTGDEVWLLDSDNRIYKNGRQDMKRFVYAINEDGIWDHESSTE